MRVLMFGLTTLAVVVGLSVIGLQFTTHDDEDKAPPLGPRLELSGTSFDLGDVPATEVVQRSVPFQNTGVEPLSVSILKVRPAPDGTCGCGVDGFEVRPETVGPGEGGELVFFLKVPEGMPNMEDKMIAELASNDPARPTFKISLIFRMDS